MGADEILVVVGAVVLSGFLGWFFFGAKQARRADVVGGMQEVKVTVKGGYSPSVIRVQEGVPLRLTFDRQEAGDCTSRVVFADFAASKSLPAFGTAVLEFTPAKVGEFDSAWVLRVLLTLETRMMEHGNYRCAAEAAEVPRRAA